MEGGSDSDDSQSDSEAYEEYLIHLEVALENHEEQDVDSLPKRQYFVLGESPVEEDG
jgi:hypothetical protein